ncbi:hypothetical protein FA95DRAFT_331731 [Auriscalpium vulgare]|uniref:Uncharacterized protein n=1 Tax=Auriscalpium vulgare TaxID=40419 RepID=A0ACB8RJR9_9AGAM|nr:hypothetical protein FA95DRAFT_331731 [Auriscalpium vulgare]
MGSSPPWEAPKLPTFSADLDPTIRAAFEQQAEFMLRIHSNMIAALGLAERDASAHTPRRAPTPAPAASQPATQALAALAATLAPAPAPAPATPSATPGVTVNPLAPTTPSQGLHGTAKPRALHREYAGFIWDTPDGGSLFSATPPPGWDAHNLPEGPIMRAAKAAAGFPGYETDAQPARRSRAPSPASSIGGRKRPRGEDEEAEEASVEPAQAPEVKVEEERPARRMRTTPSPPPQRPTRRSPRLAVKKEKHSSP